MLGARIAVIADPDCYGALKEALAGSGIAAAAGEQALIEAAQRPTDWVMAAISGAVGLKPTMAAIERGATVALANKECLVCAGALFMRSAANSGATVLPVDSEHNALFQALGAGRREDVLRVILDRIGRAVPYLDPGRYPARNARAGAAPSELVDGTEDHYRFRHLDEQGP